MLSLGHSCSATIKSEIEIVFIITIIIIIIILLLLLLHCICLVLLGQYCQFFFFMVFTKRGSGYRWTRPSLGGGGRGMMLIPSLNFKTGCFAFWDGGHYPVCCGSFNQSSCRLLPFLLSFNTMWLAGILAYQGLNLNTKAWPDCATIDKSWKEKDCTIVTIRVIIQFL